MKISDKAVKAACEEMERWGIRPGYLLAAVQDAVQAAFGAQAEYEAAVCEHERRYGPWSLTSLLTAPLLTPEQCTEARGWIDDCGWSHAGLSDDRVEWAIQRHYSGGIEQFVRDQG